MKFNLKDSDEYKSLKSDSPTKKDEIEEETPKIAKKPPNEELDEELKAILALYKDAKAPKTTERWDHSGFMALYPNGVASPPRMQQPPPQPQSIVPINVDKLEKWGHEGYNLLYGPKKTTTKHAHRKSEHKRYNLIKI